MLIKNIYIESFDRILHAGFTYKLPEEINVQRFHPETHRGLLSLHLGIPQKKIVYLNQIHSNRIVEVSEGGFAGEGDALITSHPGLVLTVKVADCIPMLVWDSSLQTIAAIHAGWRGLKSKVIQNVFDFFKKKKISPESLYILIGPYLKKCHFEVTQEFIEYFSPKFFYHKDNSIYFDPESYINEIIYSYQIPQSNIFDYSSCTYCDPHCFSYRRDNHTKARHLGYIYLSKMEGES